MRESDLQSKFTSWAKKHWNTSAAFELKITKTDKLPYSRLEDHQQYALWRAKHAFVFHKISDMSLGMKPFDCFMLAKIKHAYVGICYYHPRRKQQILLIDIDDFIAQRDAKKNRSINENTAYALAKHIVTL